MRLNYVSLEPGAEIGNSQYTTEFPQYHQDVLTESEFMQSLTDKKRRQIQAYNAQQSLLTDPDQTEMDIFAYKSDINQTKNDKIMVVQIRDKTQTVDKYHNNREYQSLLGRQIEILLPHFVDRVFNVTDMYNMVCYSIKMQSVNPVALTIMHNRMNIDQAFRHGNYGFSNYTILDIRDLQIDQTSESSRAFKQIFDSSWSCWRLEQKQSMGRYSPAIIFAPQTFGNLQEAQLENESIVIADSNNDDYVDDEKIKLKVSNVPSYTGDALVIPSKIDLSQNKSIDRLFDGSLIVPIINDDETQGGQFGKQWTTQGGYCQRVDNQEGQFEDKQIIQEDKQTTSKTLENNIYNLDIISLLSLGDNLETMNGLLKQALIQPRNIKNPGLKIKTYLNIDINSLKNLKSMESLCEQNESINTVNITNIRPDINMKQAFKNSKIRNIRLTGSIDAENIVQAFEKASNISQIDLSNLIINTQTDPKESERQTVKILWGLDMKYVKLKISRDLYNRSPRLFKKFKLENKDSIEII